MTKNQPLYRLAITFTLLVIVLNCFYYRHEQWVEKKFLNLVQNPKLDAHTVWKELHRTPHLYLWLIVRIATKHVKHRNSFIRRNAVILLQDPRLKSPHTIALLQKTIRDKNDKVRKETIKALKEMQCYTPNCLLFAKRAYERETTKTIKFAILDLLQEDKTQDCISFFLQRLQEPSDDMIQITSIGILRKKLLEGYFPLYKERVKTLLLSKVKDMCIVSPEAIYTLGKLGIEREETILTFLKLLRKAHDDKIRMRIIFAFGHSNQKFIPLIVPELLRILRCKPSYCTPNRVWDRRLLTALCSTFQKMIPSFQQQQNSQLREKAIRVFWSLFKKGNVYERECAKEFLLRLTQYLHKYSKELRTLFEKDPSSYPFSILLAKVDREALSFFKNFLKKPIPSYLRKNAVRGIFFLNIDIQKKLKIFKKLVRDKDIAVRHDAKIYFRYLKALAAKRNKK